MKRFIIKIFIVLAIVSALLLQGYNLSFGITVTSEKTEKKSSVFTYGNPDFCENFVNGSEIKKKQLVTDENIFCADKNKTMPQEGGTYNYDSYEEFSDTNKPELAYFYTTQLGNSSNDIYIKLEDIPKQKVSWVLMGQLKKGALNGDELKLYRECMAYADYKEKYIEPSVVETNPQITDNIIGPFKINYSFGSYVDVVDNEEIETNIGLIENITLLHENGEEISGTEWEITSDAQGNKVIIGPEISNLKDIKPNENFYIKYAGVSTEKITIKIELSTIKCKAKIYKYKATGPVTVPVALYFCDTCSCGYIKRETELCFNRFLKIL